jgi:hypothetical protein
MAVKQQMGTIGAFCTKILCNQPRMGLSLLLADLGRD